MESKKIGIYLHIPFCKQKCYYCDFISFANRNEFMDKYIEAMKKEIQLRLKKLKNCEVATIYIGGGTPSYIKSEYIKEILEEIYNLEKIKISKDVEITIEVNPGTVTNDKILTYKNSGVNRISIGLQSTNDNLLREIGRIHTYEDFKKTLKIIRQAGIKNVNVDLMLGLPNQTLEDINESLDEILKLDVEHISTYSLIVEENTIIEKKIAEGKLVLPDEEVERSMYWTVKDKLEENGYKHYEISNFSKEGKESRHNCNCWNQEEYLGFGIAAHSYFNGKRFSNTEDMLKYIENIKNEDYEGNITVNEIQKKDDMMREYMLLGLRKIEGVSILNFKCKFGCNPIYVFRKELEDLVNKDLIEIDGDKIFLTKSGLDLANIVWEQFV